ncbi:MULTISPECIES: hypothetical protein [unclassified Pseudomonas]|uniref:hypothetical protein n=1 Tax=unclassified Pseudomonas TaxID=196821 RepID=UPI0038164274
MQRNTKLALELLEILVVEDHTGVGLYREEIQAVFAEKYPDHEAGRREAVDYHLHLLETAGYIVLVPAEHDEPSFKPTWAGHDYLGKDEKTASFFDF